MTKIKKLGRLSRQLLTNAWELNKKNIKFKNIPGSRFTTKGKINLDKEKKEFTKKNNLVGLENNTRKLNYYYKQNSSRYSKYLPKIIYKTNNSLYNYLSFNKKRKKSVSLKKERLVKLVGLKKDIISLYIKRLYVRHLARISTIKRKLKIFKYYLHHLRKEQSKLKVSTKKYRIINSSDYNYKKSSILKIIKKYYVNVNKNLFNYYVNTFPNTFLKELECRLDSIICRLGWSITPLQSKHLIIHGHVKVNNQIMVQPSYSVKLFDKIEINKINNRKDTTFILNTARIP